MWKQLENCPPGPVDDYTKDPRYERCVQTNGIYLKKKLFKVKNY